MEYVNHRRVKGKVLCGKEVNIPAGTVFECNNKLIKLGNDAICYSTSQMGHENFARNDDGNGMERGAYTYEIAFSNRKRFNKDKTRRQRFSDNEIETLCNKWEKFLIPDIDVVLFNNDFFEADLEELKKMAADIHIRVKIKE